MAIEVPAQRVEIGDAVSLHLPGEDGTVEAKLVRWDFVTVVRGLEGR